MQRSYVRKNWPRLTFVTGIGVLLFGIASLVIPQGFGRGFIVGSGLTAIASSVGFWIVQATGTAQTMMGDLAEQWTASELRPLQRNGWRVVNHVSLSKGNTDHVILGPGGAFAIETKWSATPWEIEPPDFRIQNAAAQARGNARLLSLWKDFKCAGISVTPVVVLWGEHEGTTTSPITAIEETAILRGADLAKWRTGLPAGVLTASQIDAGWKALDRHLRLRDASDAGRQPLPPSIADMAITLSATVVSACLAFFTGAVLWDRLHSFPWWIPACLVLILTAAPGLRRKWSRYAAIGWQVGMSCAIASIGAYAILL